MQSFNINEHRDLIRMLMALGDAYLEKGLYSDAAKKYTQLLDLKVVHKNIYINLSKAYIGLNKLDEEAITVFKRAIQYDPANAELCKILAISFLNEGREDPEALKIYHVALRHDTPIFDKLAERVGMIYFKQGEFRKCKETVQMSLQRSGYRPSVFSLFIHSCWSVGLLNDAISQLKQLIDTADDKHLIAKYLCITFLEKKFAADLQDQISVFTLMDKQITLNYLKSVARFHRLQDLSLFLELKRFLGKREYWDDADTPTVRKAENVYVLESVEGYEEHLEQEKAIELPHHNITYDILEKLQTFEATTGRSIRPGTPTHSALTYEDFKKEGAAIFSKSESETAKWKMPGDLDILITIEMANYDHMRSNLGRQHVELAKRKLFVILFEMLEKHQMTHIWLASNGFLIFANDLIDSVSFASSILSKLNRLNHMNEPSDEIHLSIGIHRGREGFGQNNTQTLRDLSIGVKIGIANERELPPQSKYNRAVSETDRIFITGRAFREIRNSNRFAAHAVGEVQFKYFSDPIGLYEVDWRNPIDELSLGHIKQLGRFDLLADLGKRGVFQAYKAKDSILRRIVLLKVVKSEVFNSLSEKSEQKRAFFQMAKALGQMSHPNIANIYEVEEDKGLTYIVREYIEGAPITEVFQSKAKFNAERLMQIILQICKGLHYAHQLGFFHLKLKPSNIRVGMYDDTKIMDFHNPKAVFHDKDAEQADDDEGRYYLSPEQVTGQACDQRSDIFSLGAMLYQVATGMNPFEGSTEQETRDRILTKDLQAPADLNDQLPKFCEILIMKCLQKTPEKRFQTLGEMMAVIKKAIENGIVSNFNYHIAQSRDQF
ncbi:MAG: protein kinase [bacterium]